MTNLEWLKKRINEMSAEEIGKAWANEENPLWCDEMCVAENCIDCVKKWANKPHEEPMPELEVGMMVKVTDAYDAISWGIIREREGRKIVTYVNEAEGFDWVDDEDITIEAIYDAPSFIYARQYEESIIWRRD